MWERHLHYRSNGTRLARCPEPCKVTVLLIFGYQLPIPNVHTPIYAHSVIWLQADSRTPRFSAFIQAKTQNAYRILDVFTYLLFAGLYVCFVCLLVCSKTNRVRLHKECLVWMTCRPLIFGRLLVGPTTVLSRRKS